jgi:hypothetical protein
MNQWSARRRAFVFFLVLLFLIVIIGLPVFFLFYKQPTCMDAKQNGDEAGVDCGGSCQLLCPAESLPLLSQGDPRVLEIADGIYEVVALFKNPNASAEVERARYVIKVYGSEALPLQTIEAEAFIPKNSTFAVFEGPFELDGEPVRATVEWRGDYLVWQRNTKDTSRPSARNVLLSKEDTSPRVDAVLMNNSLDRMENVDATALVYDVSGNIIGASKTFLAEIPAGESRPVVFAWPRPFGSDAVSTEVITRLLPDESYIR